METSDYLDIRKTITELGYGGDIEWAQNVQGPDNAVDFAREHAFIVCNSGMKAQVARGIFNKIIDAIDAGQHPSSVFGHKGKAQAIWDVWCKRDDWYRRYTESTDKVAFLETMPWVGSITKWHLAKNFGIDAVKPDRHLVRVADRYKTTPDELCEKLALATGDRIGTVDYVIWRACNLGLIRSREAM
ncbi:hypothetical protein R70006_06255 [Paraburkholderia domus]|uniref:hypothetical protein n=1 Tax=Paraburkholderia domus TaxID=2793075 RepID=UPI001911E855|nr:hypothetical protein [Paraburkholderia domus]MBK5052887.1 hypothetical protein [Burkholderia sp. R-70006]CAE6822207.1 hypothetical protein R70006_06255 [Paraburkholderia domus]